MHLYANIYATNFVVKIILIAIKKTKMLICVFPSASDLVSKFIQGAIKLLNSLQPSTVIILWTGGAKHTDRETSG